MREQGEVLEGHADAAEFGVDAGHVLAVDDDAARVGIEDTGDQAQQHRLAGAGRAEQDEDLAVVHGERNIVEHGVVLEPLDDVVKFERRHMPYPFTAPSDRPSTR